MKTGHIHAARIDTASRTALLWVTMRSRQPGEWIPAPELAKTIHSGCIATDVSALRNRLKRAPQPTIHGVAVGVRNRLEPAGGNEKDSYYRLEYGA